MIEDIDERFKYRSFRYLLDIIFECYPQQRKDNHLCVYCPNYSNGFDVDFKDVVNFLDYHGALICPIGANSGSYWDKELRQRVSRTFYPSIVVNSEKCNELGVSDFLYFVRNGTARQLKIENTAKEILIENTAKEILAKQPTFIEDDYSDYDSKEEIVSSRNSHEYVEFRNMVLRRDRYCQCCGYDKNHKHLVVHHIFGFKNYPQLGYNEDNGITLCKWCHEKYHSIYGKKNPNPVTFGEYMRKYGRD